MNVRMMPPQGPMGQPMPMGGAPAPMGGPMGPPPMPMGGPGTFPVPPMQPTAGQQNKKGLGSTFGGNAQGRGQFKNFMSAKKQTSALVPQMQPSMQPMGSVPPMAQPSMAPQPMLPGPAPQMMGALRPMGNAQVSMPIQAGRPMRGSQGGLGSAPVQLNRGGEVEIPRRTDIYGQDHMLAYIRPDEAQLLKGLGGMGTPGPGGVPQFGWLADTWAEITSGGAAVTETYNSGSGSSSSGGGGYEDAAYGGSQADFYTGGGFSDNDNDNDNTSTTVTTTVPTYTDTSSITGISDASGVDYGSIINPDYSVFPNLDSDTTAALSNLSSGYEDAAYGGNQADFYTGGGFGTDNDSESDDSDTVTVVTGSSGYPSLDATAGVNTGTDYSFLDSDEEEDFNLGTGATYDDTYDSGTVVVGGADDSSSAVSQPVEPTVYYDMFGGEHATQEAANAADKAYTDAQQTAVEIVTGASDGIPGYYVGDTEYQGPDIDLGPSQQEIDASNNTAKLMNDYSTISDDYSTFQGNDLSTGDGNTIGYATGGSKVGYAAVVNPVTGGIDIYTPGSESIEASFAAEELEDALNYLTDGDVDLSNLDAPADLLAGSVTGTETGDVGLESGIDAIEDIIQRLDTEGLDSFGYDGTDAERLEAMNTASFSGDLTGIPDDALDFVEVEKTDAEKVQDLVNMGVDRSLAEAQIASGGEIGEPAGIDAYDFGPTDALTSSQFDLTGGEESESGDVSVDIRDDEEDINLFPVDIRDDEEDTNLFPVDIRDDEEDTDLFPASTIDYGGRDPMRDQAPTNTSTITDTIKAFEGFSDSTYYDVNAERAGYGSDTKTDPVTGEVTNIEPGMTVTREEAEADLNRRLTTEFIPSVVNAVGADTFYAMDPATQAALTSIAYNYGTGWADKLPTLANAAKTGDKDQIADAIADRAGDNDGVNESRRLAEAEMVRSGTPVDSNIVSTVQAGVETSPVIPETEIAEIQSQLEEQIPNNLLEKFLSFAAYAVPIVGSTIAKDLRERGPAEREALVQQHVDAIQNGATPKYDDEGRYLGYDISTMGTFADKALAADDISVFLPPTDDMTEEEIARLADADGDGQIDAERLGELFDAQSIAAEQDPYGMSTEDGFIVTGVDDQGNKTETEYVVNTGGGVNQVGQKFDSDGDGQVDTDVEGEDTDTFVEFERDGGDEVEDIFGLNEEEEETSDDEPFVDPCPEGFVLDPVLGECVPIDEVDATAGTPSLGDVIRPDTGSSTPTPTPTPDPVDPMIIRGPKQFNEGGEVEMYDMTVGPNESIGNDMVMLTFPDGTKGQTQKALYEAANSLGAFDNMESQKDFADWHLNTWAKNVTTDPEYIAAHDQFNTNQIAYNDALMASDPQISQNRMAFVQQNAPDNQAAIDAAQSLVDQYSGAAGAGIAGAGVNNMGADNIVAENNVADPFNNNYMSPYPIYNYSEGMGDDDAEIIDEFDYEKMIEELNLPVGSMILRTPKQFNVGGAVTPNIDRFMQSLGV